jgi:hypothetical protein
MKFEGFFDRAVTIFYSFHLRMSRLLEGTMGVAVIARVAWL